MVAGVPEWNYSKPLLARCPAMLSSTLMRTVMAGVTFEGAFERKKEKHADLAAVRLQPGWRAVGSWGPRQHRNIFSAAPEDHGIQCEEGVRSKGSSFTHKHCCSGSACLKCWNPRPHKKLYLIGNSMRRFLFAFLILCLLFKDELLVKLQERRKCEGESSARHTPREAAAETVKPEGWNSIVALRSLWKWNRRACK